MQPQPPPPPPALAPAPYARPRRGIPVLVPHLIWDAVLLLLVVVVSTGVLLATRLFEGDGIWWTMAINGLFASALALSFRTATPNLAVLGLAGISAAIYAELVDQAGLPWPVAALLGMLAALVLGSVLGLIVGLTSAPAWAVSLAGLALAQGILFGVSGVELIQVGSTLPLGGAAWFALAVLISLAGGALFAIPPVRRLLSANRTAGGGVRFSGGRLLGAMVGFAGSSVLAGFGGVLVVSQYRAFEPSFFLNIDSWLLTAVAAVLLGGVSVFGGRGGVAGTILAVTLLSLILSWLAYEDLFGHWGRLLVLGFAAMIGIGVSRLIEAIAPGVADDPAPPAFAPAPAPAPPPPPAQSAYPAAPPAEPATEPATEPVERPAPPPGGEAGDSAQ